jgi:hypothetical protein
MAKLSSEFLFTGSLGELSAYRMRGVNGIILRKKAGPTKAQVANSPNFEKVRRINKEFGGRSTMSKMILDALRPLKIVADFNVSGELNARLKPVQEKDGTSAYGKRSINVSEHHAMLSGMSFNRARPLESFVASPITAAFSKENLLATIDVPELIPGFTFRNFGQYPYYRFILSVGAVRDLHWTQEGYRPLNDASRNQSAHVFSDWRPSQGTAAATSLSVALKLPAHNEPVAYIVGVGICFGEVNWTGIAPTRFGAAKLALTS